ncbi:MAG: thioredoxin domain-containing protein [Fibrobacterales bacterium]
MFTLPRTLILASIALFGCRSSGDTMQHTNALINETSPYLQMHAHNPVNWYPWGTEAFEKAKTENKLVIISIGYAACHWCHVMEHETFSDDTAAEMMNERFVSIKVDREERPDVDQIYMDAVHLLSGSGGWPLNAIALPDGRPIYAGTYYPKKQWLELLQKLDTIYATDPQKVLMQAENITNGIKRGDLARLGDYSDHTFMDQDIQKIHSHIMSGMDMTHGGTEGAPKFPMPVGIEFLLQHSYYYGEESTHKAVSLTLDKMAMGGIYDQLGGAFARYSVDRYWKVPHFEKMLYDNGQLIELYSKAYKQTKNPLYKETVYQTIEFLNSDMSSDKDAFYAAYDADSEGEEGKFYAWSANDIDRILGTDAPLFKEVYTISQRGNWEHGKNVIHRDEHLEHFASKHKVPLEDLHQKLLENKALLYNARLKRISPALDDKIITSWNALTISGLVAAYEAFSEPSFLHRATTAITFVLDSLATSDGGLYHNYKKGSPTIRGFSDDYAFVIKALIELYEATFDEQWITKADTLMAYTIEHFWDNKAHLFQYTPKESNELIADKYESADNVTPASNSVLAENLFKLGALLDKTRYNEMHKRMVNVVYRNLPKGGYYYSNWSRQLMYHTAPHYEVAIVGPEAEKVRNELAQYYLPNTILLGGESEGTLALLEHKLVAGKTTMYVCRGKVCDLPTTKVADVLKQVLPQYETP